LKRVVCCLAWGVLSCAGQVPGEPSARIAVYLGFQHAPPERVLEALEREVAAILTPLRGEIEWRELAGNHLGESADDLAVVTFNGRCEPGLTPPQWASAAPLGLTHVSDGVVLPFSEVNCDRLRAYLQHALPPGQRERATLFGRAAGRVLAHELYHVFARTSHHGALGVSKARFTVKELMAPVFRLPESAGAFLSGGGNGHPGGGATLYAESGCGFCHGPQGEGGARAPALRTGKAVDREALSARLKKNSPMYRRARSAKAAWPLFAQRDIDRVLEFLNRPGKPDGDMFVRTLP
jgi:hypothetical protein